MAQYKQYQKAMERGEKIKTYTKAEAEQIKAENERAITATLLEKEGLEKEMIEVENKLLHAKMEGEKFNGELQQLKDNVGGKKDTASRLMIDLKGESIESIKRKNLSASDLRKFKESVEKFDNTLSELRKQSDAIRLKMSDDDGNSENSAMKKKLDAERVKKEQLSYEVDRLKKKMNETMTAYLAASKYKVEKEKMEKELAVVEQLKPVLKQTKVVEQLYKQKLSKYVKAAAKAFSVMTENRYTFNVDDDILFVDNATKEPVTFAEMPVADRYVAYIALCSTLPNVSNGQNDTVVLKGNIKADKGEIADRLKLLHDKVFVCTIAKASDFEKPKTSKKTKETA
jgi:hypothetical protein